MTTEHRSDDVGALSRAERTAREWIGAVAEQLHTQDQDFAYRVLRAWLRTVRDRLDVGASAHFAAQLPLLLRGVYFDGWTPSRVPVKYDAEQFVLAFGQEARTSLPEARRAVRAVTAALIDRCSPGQVDHLLARLPERLRATLSPTEPPAPPAQNPAGARADQTSTSHDSS